MVWAIYTSISEFLWSQTQLSSGCSFFPPPLTLSICCTALTLALLFWWAPLWMSDLWLEPPQLLSVLWTNTPAAMLWEGTAAAGHYFCLTHRQHLLGIKSPAIVTASHCCSTENVRLHPRSLPITTLLFYCSFKSTGITPDQLINLALNELASVT